MKYSLVLCIFALITLASAGKMVWTNEAISNEDYKYRRASMYTLEDAPFGSDEPYISFNVSFAGSDEAIWIVHTYLIHSSMVRQLGVEAPYGRVYCCVPELEAAGACNITTTPLIDLSPTAALLYELPEGATLNQLVHTKTFSTGTNETSVNQYRWSGNFSVTYSGFWYLYLLNCESESAVVNGETVFRNSYGYLPASLLPYLPMYFIFLILYTLVALAWWALVFMHRAVVVRIQVAIGVLIVLNVLENLFFSIEWGVYNNTTGAVEFGLSFFVSVFYTLRSVGSYVLLLLVGMGWKVFRPKIQYPFNYGLYALTGAALLCTFLYELLALLEYSPDMEHIDIPNWLITVFGFFAVLIDFGFVAWTVLELYRSIYVLDKHQQTYKLRIYRQLVAILIVAVVIVVVLFIIEAGLAFGGAVEESFQALWVFGSAYPILFFFIHCSICYLLRPSESNLALSMVQLAGVDNEAGDGDGDGDERGGVALEKTAGGPGDDDDGDAEKDAATAAPAKSSAESDETASGSGSGTKKDDEYDLPPTNASSSPRRKRAAGKRAHRSGKSAK